ncbi:interleukin-31 receptor subunit alpha-like [Protopterus annectens]|uniref:interleukin-31 receptor subunit alpha-like n=1 Tax=Protopterus annectens TaxID=7888 RepID=UPI001CFB822C|nr:interleukin-31 receptor subunit alpha-like [Protopterus annectens]
MRWEPSVAPDLWRVVGPVYRNSTRKVEILFQKNRHVEHHEKILGYKVFRQSHGIRTNIKDCNINGKCHFVVDLGSNDIYVTSYNTKGESPPAHVAMEQEGLAKPRNVQITSVRAHGISVKWEAPISEKTLVYFLIEWIDHEEKQNNVLWKKIPSTNISAFISENIKEGVRYNISLYAVYSDGVSNPVSSQIYSVEMVPRLGPEVSVKETVKDKASVEWIPIPASEQRGFITCYSIYLTKMSDGAPTEPLKYVVESFKTHYMLSGLTSDKMYSVHMTASTSAGEGPSGKKKHFRTGKI